MSFLLYLVVLVAAAVSVVMGVDLVAGPPPLAPKAVQVQAFRPPPVPPMPDATPVAPSAPPADDVPRPAPQQSVSQAVEDAPEPPCNVQACTAAYHSFRATDCTYQPLSGPRRLCTK